MGISSVNLLTKGDKELVEGCTYNRIDLKSGDIYYNAKVKSISSDNKHTVEIEADNGRAFVNYSLVKDWEV